MNSLINRIQLAYQVARQLGPKTIWQYGVYQAGLKTGYFRWRTPVDHHPIQNIDGKEDKVSELHPNFFITIPPKEQLTKLLEGEASRKVIEEAEEILQGRVRLFGADTVQLCLNPTDSIRHWSLYKEKSAEDIKFIWEPARFGWAFTLGRAYLLTSDERYPESFYNFMETFLDSNPTNAGPNWISGQEVALRIFSFVYAWQIFSNSPASTSSRILRLKEAIAAHARRIPPTLCYARAQNNNHLLTEAAGLFTAGVYLTEIPEAASWRKLGWRWFNWAVQNQIADDGIYIQHSTNYHRLMLQTALWVQVAAKKQEVEFPPRTKELLGAATNWLMGQFDPISGCVPNLGHNDGAYILPLVSCAFSDYRPVIQAAASAFLGKSCLPAGTWDELGLWLGLYNPKDGDTKRQPTTDQQEPSLKPGLLGNNPSRLGNANTWASLRSVNFNDRPAHADQLHVELWWQGFNIAKDAGTYRYTATAPWQNVLMATIVHNTVQVDGQDQMRRAGRFLWLDWAQAQRLPEIENDHTRAAEQNGYQSLGLTHQRTLIWVEQNEWRIRDRLIQIQPGASTHKAVISWLLPDWPWRITEDDSSTILILQTPDSQELSIQINLEKTAQIHPANINSIHLIRAGQVIYGNADHVATLGWVSPTYNVKIPALSYQLEFEGKPPFTILTHWTLPFPK